MTAEALLADTRMRFDFGHAGTNEGRAAWRALVREGPAEVAGDR